MPQRAAADTDKSTMPGRRVPWADRERVGLIRSPRLDWSAAFFVIAVNLDRLPDTVHVIGIAAHKSVDRRPVLGIDHEDAADRQLAVVRNESTSRNDIDIVLCGLVEVNAMRTIEFGACRYSAAAVECMDHEQHRYSSSCW